MADHPEGTPAPRGGIHGEQPASNVVTSEQEYSATTTEEKDKLTFYERHKQGIERIGALALIIGAAFGIKRWEESTVNKAVDDKLSDPIILRKIAAESRPMLVFKGNESIIADEGAAQFIKEIKVAERGSSGAKDLPSHIHIELTKFFPQAPILTLISPALCVVTTERGKGLSWEFNLSYSSEPGVDDFGNQILFRFEILP